ncbi:unnamed protein product [Brachionus calyciflorus]|uniref:SWIM-type domain-containing protein n=1 Tax=Brachionus calyciflorus TaxID=104777 RepID=A0A814GQ93_9BILA|nr:unnamed protein product [Brachionus calyciflorus]
MHYSTSLENFEILKEEVLARWSLYPDLIDFKLYFTNQWLQSQWSNWKLFDRPYGFSTTNNSTESFNKIIKLIYTGYERGCIHDACLVVEKMLTDLSRSQDNFDLTIKISSGLLKDSDKLKLEDFSFINLNAAYRVANSLNKYYVQTNPKFCSCSKFLEFAVCKHYIALCRLTNQKYEEKDREFVFAKKRGRPAKSKNALAK